MMAVTVPAGVKPGGMMQVDVGGGQIMQVQVPAGVTEGDMMQMMMMNNMMQQQNEMSHARAMERQ